MVSCLAPTVAEGEGDHNIDGASDPVPTKKNTCQNVFIISVLAIFCTGWLIMGVFAFSEGNPAHLLHPHSSAGEICGSKKQSAKPNLLYHDLTKCAGIPADVGACPTRQICVEECPRTYWTAAQNKSPGLEQFCDGVTSTQMEDRDTSISQLVDERRCPAYILPSTPVLGRCIPEYGLVRGEEAAKIENKLRYIKTEDGKVLNVDSLLRGVDYVMDSIDNQGNITGLSSSWWIILFAHVLVMVLSILCTVIIKQADKYVLWASIVLCPVIWIAITMIAFFVYIKLMKSTDDASTSLPIPITSMSTYWFNKNTCLVCGIIFGVITLIIFLLILYFFKRINIALNIIEQAIKSTASIKSVLTIPILQSVLSILIIHWALTVSIFLPSSGSSQFRVVEACSSETCVNPATGKMFSMHDPCDQALFGECTGCPRAQCLHHQFVPSVWGWGLQIWNISGMVWLVMFIQALGSKVVAMVYSGEGIAGEGVWTCFKKTYREHLVPVVCASLLPWICQYRHRRITVLHLLTKLVLLAVKLFLLGLTSCVSVTVYYLQFGSSLDIHLSYQIVPVLAIGMCTWPVISALISVYDVAVDTMEGERHGAGGDDVLGRVSASRQDFQMGETTGRGKTQTLD